MPTLTVRNVDESVHAFLRKQAAEHGHSMEAEIRRILNETMQSTQKKPLDTAKRIHAIFAKIGGADDLVEALPGRDQTKTRPLTFKE